MELTTAHIFDVDVGDFQLAACGRLQIASDVHNAVIIEVQTGDNVVGFRITRLFLDGYRTAFVVKLDYAERTGVVHVVAEYAGAVRTLQRLVQIAAELRRIEDIVAQNEADVVVSDELRADQQGVRDAACDFLHLIGDVDAEAAARTEQTVERAFFSGRNDDQNIPDAGFEEHSEGIINHRFVVNGQQRLAHRARHGIKTRAFSRGKNNTFHVISSSFINYCTHIIAYTAGDFYIPRIFFAEKGGGDPDAVKQGNLCRRRQN